MTGVGPGGEVARPEIVLEGSADGSRWLPVEFRYKPTDLNRPPPLVAPHQPRLDWQMWFAALGSYHHNPWLLNLCYKLLVGSEAAFDLLEPDGHFSSKVPPKLLRATLFDYAFTSVAESRNASAALAAGKGSYWVGGGGGEGNGGADGGEGGEGRGGPGGWPDGAVEASCTNRPRSPHSPHPSAGTADSPPRPCADPRPRTPPPRLPPTPNPSDRGVVEKMEPAGVPPPDRRPQPRPAGLPQVPAAPARAVRWPFRRAAQTGGILPRPCPAAFRAGIGAVRALSRV